MWRFQSTLPVWGATHRGTGLERLHRFQSTLPVWGATVYRGGLRHKPDISIHAPRVGSDSFWPAYSQNFFYFNPRSPCGERRASIKKLTERRIFQSTLPVWGATTGYSFKSRWVSISIHAPRVGSDGSLLPHTQHSPNFNPRSPCGERHYGRVSAYDGEIFQSTLPVWGATEQNSIISAARKFQSTLPVWGATAHYVIDIRREPFQSTLPVWGATPSRYPAYPADRNFNPRSPCGERPPGRWWNTKP